MFDRDRVTQRAQVQCGGCPFPYTNCVTGLLARTPVFDDVEDQIEFSCVEFSAGASSLSMFAPQFSRRGQYRSHLTIVLAASLAILFLR